MKLIDRNRFQIAPGWFHLASVHHGVREYMCFECVDTCKIYIEEVTGGRGPDFIDDDELVLEIYNNLVRWGVLSVGKF